MTLLIYAIVVILLAGLAVYAIDRSPLPANFRWVAVVLVCLEWWRERRAGRNSGVIAPEALAAE